MVKEKYPTTIITENKEKIIIEGTGWENEPSKTEEPILPKINEEMFTIFELAEPEKAKRLDRLFDEHSIYSDVSSYAKENFENCEGEEKETYAQMGFYSNLEVLRLRKQINEILEYIHSKY